MFINNYLLGMDSVADNNHRFNQCDLWPVNGICHGKELMQVSFGEEEIFSLASLSLDDYGKMSPVLLQGN